jgi:hypothetical protein
MKCFLPVVMYRTIPDIPVGTITDIFPLVRVHNQVSVESPYILWGICAGGEGICFAYSIVKNEK